MQATFETIGAKTEYIFVESQNIAHLCAEPKQSTFSWRTKTKLIFVQSKIRTKLGQASSQCRCVLIVNDEHLFLNKSEIHDLEARTSRSLLAQEICSIFALNKNRRL